MSSLNYFVLTGLSSMLIKLQIHLVDESFRLPVSSLYSIFIISNI